jgi:uncharacterized protein
MRIMNSGDTFRPPPALRVTIPGPVGQLEAVVEEPALKKVQRFAVICHPHPQFGGTLDNKVVHTLARTLQELGLPTVRFNFRGVGRSAGTYAEGLGETDDALAVVDWGLARWPGAGLWLAGFSFGGFVALRASLVRPCERLITVAPPVQRFNFSELRVPRCPWLVVQGDADEVVDHHAVSAWTRTLTPPPRVRILSGVDHFFHGRLHELKDVVREELSAA